jgi:hypothetical protein
MSAQLPVNSIYPVPEAWRSLGKDHTKWPWEELTPFPPFILADGSGPAKDQTTVRACYDADNLYVRYDCEDYDIWGESTERDSAIYNEEVVELFIGPGEDHPVHYYEFEVSPLGTMLDLEVYSPNLERQGLKGNFAWDCPGLQWSAERNDAANHWHAYMVIPWLSIGAKRDALPRTWRANFYRIERPRGKDPEFSCWSPTLTSPADFHKPARFGILKLAEAHPLTNQEL